MVLSEAVSVGISHQKRRANATLLSWQQFSRTHPSTSFSSKFWMPAFARMTKNQAQLRHARLSAVPAQAGARGHPEVEFRDDL